MHILFWLTLIAFGLHGGSLGAQDRITFEPLIEEFCSGYMPKGSDVAVKNIPKWGVGDLNWAWSLTNTSGSAFSRPDQGDVNHPCTITATTGNVSRNEATLRLCPQNLADKLPCRDNTAHQSFTGFTSLTFDTYIIFKLHDTTDVNVQAGFMDESNEDKAELTVEYDSSRGDKYLTFVARNSGGTCKLDTDCKHLASDVVPVTDRWIKARIRSITPGTVLFSVCMGATPSAGCRLSASKKFVIGAPFIPKGPMTPALHLQTRANANKSVTWDYFSFAIHSGFSR